MAQNEIKRSKALLIIITAVAATGGLLFGFDTGVISGTLPFLKEFWSLTEKQISWITTSGLIGAIIGAAFSGRLTDKWGRKVVILASALIFSFGAIWTSVAASPTSLFIGRLFIGIAIGISSYSVPMYLAEISPSKQRGALVSAFQLLITIGIFVSYLSDRAFAVENDLQSWRPMFMVGIIPALILLIGMIFLPETPRYLIGSGKEEKGREILQKLEEPELVEESIQKMKDDIALDAQASKSWKDILQPWLRTSLFIGIGIMFIQQFIGINTVIYYCPEIFEKAGYTAKTAQIAASISVGFVNVLFTIVSMFIIDRIGRRKLFFVGVAGNIVALVALALSFALKDSLGMSLRYVTVGLVLLYIVFFAISLGPLGWLLISEIFPLKIRGVGMSICALSNWLFNALVTFTFLPLLEALTPTGAFLCYAAVGVIGLIWGYYYIPETKGHSLEYIEEHWRQGKKPREL